jgi:hypothetical protein
VSIGAGAASRRFSVASTGFSTSPNPSSRRAYSKTERRIWRYLLTVRALTPERSRADRNLAMSAGRMSPSSESLKVRLIRALGPFSRPLTGSASIIRWSRRVEGLTRFSCST